MASTTTVSFSGPVLFSHWSKRTLNLYEGAGRDRAV